MRHLAFLSISLLVIASVACDRHVADTPPTLRPVATVAQLMDAIVIPSSQALFDAVVYSNGEVVQSPKTDDDWHRLQMQAIAVAEAGNLLMLPPRARDDREWAALSRAMVDAAARTAEAAAAKSRDRLLTTSGALYDTCTACHRRYVPRSALGPPRAPDA
jgi:hypothetical protein